MTTFAEIKSEIANWRTFTIIVFFLIILKIVHDS